MNDPHRYDRESATVFAKKKRGYYSYVCEESFMSTELNHIITPALIGAYRIGNTIDNMPKSVIKWAEHHGYEIKEVEINYKLIDNE